MPAVPVQSHSPSLDELAAWRTQSIFFVDDVARIARVSHTIVLKWFASTDAFLLGETYRVEGDVFFPRL